MKKSPGFPDALENCKVPLSGESNCKKCINAGIVYLHHLLGNETNITFGTCRDATFAAVASQVDDASAVDIANCFFQVQGLKILPGTHTLAEKGNSIVCNKGHNFLFSLPLNFLVFMFFAITVSLTSWNSFLTCSFRI